MGKIVIIILGVLFLIVLGGGIFLASWNIPAPTTKVEKQIPDDKLPR